MVTTKEDTTNTTRPEAKKETIKGSGQASRLVDNFITTSFVHNVIISWIHWRRFFYEKNPNTPYDLGDPTPHLMTTNLTHNKNYTNLPRERWMFPLTTLFVQRKMRFSQYRYTHQHFVFDFIICMGVC